MSVLNSVDDLGTIEGLDPESCIKLIRTRLFGLSTDLSYLMQVLAEKITFLSTGTRQSVAMKELI